MLTTSAAGAKVAKAISPARYNRNVFIVVLCGLARGQMGFCQCGWFADEIVQLAGYSRELVRNSIGNNDDLAFIYLMFFTAFDFGAADFVRRDFLCIDGFPTGDQ